MASLEQSGGMVCKAYAFNNSNLLSYKNWKQNEKTSNTALVLLLWMKVLFFAKKCWFFAKNANISNVKVVLVIKGTISVTKYVCLLI